MYKFSIVSENCLQHITESHWWISFFSGKICYGYEINRYLLIYQPCNYYSQTRNNLGILLYLKIWKNQSNLV